MKEVFLEIWKIFNISKMYFFCYNTLDPLFIYSWRVVTNSYFESFQIYEENILM